MLHLRTVWPLEVGLQRKPWHVEVPIRRSWRTRLQAAVQCPWLTPAEILILEQHYFLLLQEAEHDFAIFDPTDYDGQPVHDEGQPVPVHDEGQPVQESEVVRGSK